VEQKSIKKEIVILKKILERSNNIKDTKIKLLLGEEKKIKSLHKKYALCPSLSRGHGADWYCDIIDLEDLYTILKKKQKVDTFETFFYIIVIILGIFFIGCFFPWLLLWM